MSEAGDPHSGLARAAAVALDRLGVVDVTSFLVVCNPGYERIATALAHAARTRTGEARLLEFPALSRNGEEPPPHVAHAMQRATAIAIVTRFSLSHTHARAKATRAGVRIASMPNISEDMFTRMIPVDYRYVETTGRELAQRLTDCTSCRVHAPGGTAVELSLAGRRGICDDGDLSAPGAFGNLPAGEAYIAPIETTGDGQIVFDGSLTGWGLLEQPVVVELVAGQAVSITGGPAAEWWIEKLKAGGEHGRTIAELGIGTNPAARITGIMLEDEKAQDTVHLALGTNTGFGGTSQAGVHMDALIRDATVELDGHPIQSEPQFPPRRASRVARSAHRRESQRP